MKPAPPVIKTRLMAVPTAIARSSLASAWGERWVRSGVGPIDDQSMAGGISRSPRQPDVVAGGGLGGGLDGGLVEEARDVGAQREVRQARDALRAQAGERVANLARAVRDAVLVE